MLTPVSTSALTGAAIARHSHLQELSRARCDHRYDAHVSHHLCECGAAAGAPSG